MSDILKLGLVAMLLACAGFAGGQGIKKGKASRRVSTEDKETVRHRFPVAYSVDNVVWKPKGFVAVGEYYHVWFDGAFEEWGEAAAEVVSKKYFLKVASEPAEDHSETAFAKSVQIAVSVCELVNAAFSEHYHVTFSPHTDSKNFIVGISPFGAAYTKTRAPGLDACTPDNLRPRFAAMPGSRAHDVVVADRPPQRPATFGPNTKDEPIYQQPQNAQAKREQARLRAERGETPDEAEKPEKTWFEKYWLYIVVGIMILRLQGAAEPPQGGQQGGAAPAARK